MNPLTNMKNVVKLSERELNHVGGSSWHDQYKDSAWVFIGGLPYDLTEGDIICVFSQYGEIVNINLIRDKETGKSRGFCFICYEDQRSTILAVDNFNGIKLLNRIIRVDHVADYKVPKEGKKPNEEKNKLFSEGCAPKPTIRHRSKSPPGDHRETIADQIEADMKLPARLPIVFIKKEKTDESWSPESNSSPARNKLSLERKNKHKEGFQESGDDSGLEGKRKRLISGGKK